MKHELTVIDRSVSRTYDWLGAIADRGNYDDLHRAYQVLRVVLHALRDRIGSDQAAHLSAQLPTYVRGVFYEGWDPSVKPRRTSFAEFLARVEAEARLKGPSEAEEATRVVLGVLWDEVGDGTMEHLMSVLPGEFAVVL